MSDVSGLQSQIQELRAAVSSLARKAAEPASPVVRRTFTESSSSASSGPGFTLVDQEVLAESGSYSGSSGDWATTELYASVSETATYAYVRFRGVCVQESEAIAIRVRSDDMAGEREPLSIAPIETTADTCSNDNAEWIPLSDSQTFEFQPTWAMAPTWSIVLLGYA